MLPTSILVAVDFSVQSRHALALGARLAVQCHAKLHVVHVEDPLLTAAAARDGIDLAVDTREELARFIDSTPPAAAIAPCRDVATGAPVAGILQLAEREGADIIVLGTHGMSGAGRLLFGSVTEGVLRHATRSILIAPDDWTPPRPETDDLSGAGPLIVGIDFSPSSLAAATAACTLAERLQTSVEAIHVVPSLPVLDRWRPHAERLVAERLDLSRRDLALLMAGITTPIAIARSVETGNVADRLVEAAAPLGTRHPIIVVGRRQSKTQDGVPGSTAYRIATLAGVPVLMHTT
jgi:nucleotide-binding universal stress UspA family protein